MTLTNIKAVTDRKGKVRRYLQVKGQKLSPLPDAPVDSPDFLAAWAAAMKVAKGGKKQPGSEVAENMPKRSKILYFSMLSGWIRPAATKRKSMRKPLATRHPHAGGP